MYYSQQASSIYSQMLDFAISNNLWGEGGASSFSVKVIKDKSYLYRHVSMNGESVSISLGRIDMDLESYLKMYHRPEDFNISSLTKMFNADPLVSRLHRPIEKVIEVIAGFGLFRAGGILLGSNVMSFYANMLGYKFSPEAIQTIDVDIASVERGSDEYAILFPDAQNIKLENELTAKGFDRILGLNHRHPATSYSTPSNNGGQKGHIDILCPMKGPTSSNPVFIKSLQCYAEPLRYLDYLTEDTQLGVMNNGKGTLIRVPTPARFALHKLVVATRRPVAQAAKSRKDVLQAELLLDYLAEEREDDIVAAYDAANMYGEKFVSIINKGVSKLDPSLKEKLYSAIPEMSFSGKSTPNKLTPK